MLPCSKDLPCNIRCASQDEAVVTHSQHFSCKEAKLLNILYTVPVQPITLLREQ